MPSSSSFRISVHILTFSICYLTNDLIHFLCNNPDSYSAVAIYHFLVFCTMTHVKKRYRKQQRSQKKKLGFIHYVLRTSTLPYYWYVIKWVEEECLPQKRLHFRCQKKKVIHYCGCSKKRTAQEIHCSRIFTTKMYSMWRSTRLNMKFSQMKIIASTGNILTTNKRYRIKCYVIIVYWRDTNN